MMIKILWVMHACLAADIAEGQQAVMLAKVAMILMSAEIAHNPTVR
jgi:hypothetical protein